MSLTVECEVRVARLGLAYTLLLNVLPLGLVLSWLWTTRPSPLWGVYALFVGVAMVASVVWHGVLYLSIPLHLRVLGRDLLAYKPLARGR